MPVLLSDNSRKLAPIDYSPELLMNGGGGFEFPRGGDFFSLPVGAGGSGGPPASFAAAPSAPLDFDFDLSQIGRATARGNTEADVRSAYELFSTGSTRGRAMEYAQSDIARFGYPSLRHAAAAYLDAAGLPRLAQFVSPGPVGGGGDLIPDSAFGNFFSLPTPPIDATAPTSGGGGGSGTGAGTTARNPFEILADVLPKLFGGAVYNPPLQSQAYGYTPANVSAQDVGGGSGGLGSLGGWLILGGLAVAAFFIYKKVKGGA